MKLALVAPTHVGVLETARAIADQVPVDFFTIASQSTSENRLGRPSAGERERGLTRFAFRPDYSVAPDLARRLSEVLGGPGVSYELETRWIQERAPHSSVLLDQVISRQDTYDAVFYFSLAWATTVFGLEQIERPSVIVPLPEDAPFVGVGLLRDTLARADGIIWASAEEEERFAASIPAKKPRVSARADSPAAFLEMARRIGRAGDGAGPG